MLIQGNRHESITYIPARLNSPECVKIIDQRLLPFKLVFCELSTLEDVIIAIRDMKVRGAPLIGITAAFGLLFSLNECQGKLKDDYIARVIERLVKIRPTAYNTHYCLNRILQDIQPYKKIEEIRDAVLRTSLSLIDEDRSTCRSIGEYGLSIIKEIAEKKGRVNILTHCNAGWLACVDYGTATAPMYLAHEMGIDLHVWVDETRPKNQGARLTVWELTQNGIKNSLITDNAGGILMQKNLVDLVIVGCDRVTQDGKVTNKIGTYLKALAAKDNNVPFYVALPSSTIDRTSSCQPVKSEQGKDELQVEALPDRDARQKDLKKTDSYKNIPIENRDASEVRYVEGRCDDTVKTVLITEKDVKVYNPGFDVTPAKYITGLITEKGVCKASYEEINRLFPGK